MQFDTQLLPRNHGKPLRDNGQQYYMDDKGNRFPSVTTILNATKPQVDRDRLSNWKARIGTEEVTRISTTASRRGTQTHKQIERYLLGENPICSEASRPYWESIKPVLEKIDTVRLVEGSVFHYDLSYSGKVDCVASYKSVPCICEWKTADKPKGTVERLYEYPLQLTAYLGAVNEYYRDYGIDLNHALLVIAIPEIEAEVFWFEPQTMNSFWQKWEQRVAEYWQRRQYRGW
ncbi:MAG: PD-(D/E)XK nuclease family protein [Chlorogloeopsis fritschii C42_A2020_084]|uniref:PD-(D/E)XK nuclease family protein n=1 Tax=Chlorogloeopsis fritschii TaxID=1124 RepID=UPI0019F9E809|nr:PD-(D/E)XK nuclease family protein [Chlorogloeopsis fritschii]MBF2005416.1 PD-(D/E)XK nuclease family protein [Chlorogloeopsis fritschii C42_A2020_084]